MIAIAKIVTLLKRAAGMLVVGLFSWMVFLATAQLILRWLKIDALSWSDIQLRHFLLWYGLAGGILATAEGRQIHIDLAGHYFPKRIRDIIARGVSVLSSLLCFYLTYVSLQFLSSEKGGGSKIAGLLFGAAAPIWWVEIALPIAFSLMGTLFLLHTFLPPSPLTQDIKR